MWNLTFDFQERKKKRKEERIYLYVCSVYILIKISSFGSVRFVSCRIVSCVLCPVPYAPRPLSMKWILSLSVSLLLLLLYQGHSYHHPMSPSSRHQTDTLCHAMPCRDPFSFLPQFMPASRPFLLWVLHPCPHPLLSSLPFPSSAFRLAKSPFHRCHYRRCLTNLDLFSAPSSICIPHVARCFNLGHKL